jgi:hypothetical protein
MQEQGTVFCKPLSPLDVAKDERGFSYHSPQDIPGLIISPDDLAPGRIKSTLARVAVTFAAWAVVDPENARAILGKSFDAVGPLFRAAFTIQSHQPEQ